MDLEEKSFVMETSMLVITTRVNHQGMDNIIGKMAVALKVILKMD